MKLSLFKAKKLTIITFQPHICFWWIFGVQDFRKKDSLKNFFSIFSGFAPPIPNILIQLDKLQGNLAIKFGKYDHQRNCEDCLLVTQEVQRKTYLSLSLSQRMEALCLKYVLNYPWVHSTCEQFCQSVKQRTYRKYQMACNWSFNSIARLLFSMNSQTSSNSSLAPASKPSESWKIKLLPGYVI